MLLSFIFEGLSIGASTLPSPNEQMNIMLTNQNSLKSSPAIHQKEEEDTLLLKFASQTSQSTLDSALAGIYQFKWNCNTLSLNAITIGSCSILLHSEFQRLYGLPVSQHRFLLRLQMLALENALLAGNFNKSMYSDHHFVVHPTNFLQAAFGRLYLKSVLFLSNTFFYVEELCDYLIFRHQVTQSFA